MTSATATPEAPPASRSWATAVAARAGVLSVWLLLLLPGALTVFLSFNSGGRGPEATSVALALVALLLMSHSLLARQPFAGFSRPLLVGGGLLLAFCGWTWMSSAWSDAPARSLLEFQRTVLYLLALLLFGASVRHKGGVSLLLKGVAGGIVVVCLAALATRLYPDLFSISSAFARERLAYPISYWNALGLLAGVGTVLLLHLACEERGTRLVRALGAAGVPIAALTVYLTLSRGAAAAVVIGVLVYLVVAHSRGAVAGLISTAPTTYIAVRAGYDAELLTAAENTTAAATAQGHDVAGVLLLCCGAAAMARLALSPLDASLTSLTLAPKTREASRLVAALLVVAGLALTVAAEVPQRVEKEWSEFTRPEEAGDARTRLRDTSVGVRRNHWDVALASYRADRLKGSGAGTFEIQWLQSRTAPQAVKDAHSLYYELLSELGLVGFVLLVGAFAAILIGLTLRARGPRRALYGAVLGVSVMWMAHAGVDWDWELPGVTLWMFALMGVALARRRPRRGWGAEGSWPVRGAVAVACLVIAVGAVRTMISESALDEGTSALSAGNCGAARSHAASSLEALSIRPQPLAIIAYCDAERGRLARAVEAMQTAVRLDPQHWRYRYGLGVMRAWAGGNPRPDIMRARRLNPRAEVLTTGVVATLARADRRDWRRLARRAPIRID